MHEEPTWLVNTNEQLQNYLITLEQQNHAKLDERTWKTSHIDAHSKDAKGGYWKCGWRRRFRLERWQQIHKDWGGVPGHIMVEMGEVKRKAEGNLDEKKEKITIYIWTDEDTNISGWFNFLWL